ncbi:MAG: cysteine desulfurase family protein [Bradymonadia bacterium]
MTVYLDHNATSPVSRDVLLAIEQYGASGWGNPSSVHRRGRSARAVVERTRHALARELGCEARELTFTSGATEAIDLALKNMVPRDRRVVVSAVEHPAVIASLEALSAEVIRVPCDESGRLSADAFGAACDEQTAAVVVMLAQNEIGNIYPIREIVDAVAPIPVFCDIVQAFGRMPVKVDELGVKGVCLSGHKFGAPSGIGALWLSGELDFRPVIHGGPQERGRRAGTENMMGIVGFSQALEELAIRRKDGGRQRKLIDLLIDGIHSSVGPIVIHGDRTNCLANTLNFRIEGVPGELLLQALDLADVHVSSGSACSSGGLEPSATLLALGLTATQARSGIRVSIGPETSVEDIKTFCEKLGPIVMRIRANLADEVVL